MRSIEPLLLWMRIDSEVSRLAQGYLSALSWGVLGAYGYHTLKQMTEGVGRTVPIMVVMGVMLPINIGINYILMFGKLGFDPLGAIGCGFGNALSFWLMFLMLASYIFTSRYYKKFDIACGKLKIEWEVFRRLISLGLPIGVSLFLQSGLFTTVALLMASLGTVAVAAHQIVLSYSGLVFMVPLGLAMALTVCVGQAVGRGDVSGAGRIGYVGIVTCMVLSSVSAITTFYFGPAIATIYTQDKAVLELSVMLFKLAALLQLGDGIQVAGAFALRGLKDTRVPLILNAINYWGFGFVAAYVLGVIFELGAQGVWTGLSFALLSAAFLMVARFVFLIRVMRLKDLRQVT
jgi:MATE family multidrug resistance protein